MYRVCNHLCSANKKKRKKKKKQKNKKKQTNSGYKSNMAPGTKDFSHGCEAWDVWMLINIGAIYSTCPTASLLLQFCQKLKPKIIEKSWNSAISPSPTLGRCVSQKMTATVQV